MPRMTPSERRAIVKEAARRMRSVRPRVSSILRRLGPLGGLIQALADAIAGGQQAPSSDQIEAAKKILSDQGFDIRAPGDPIAPPRPGSAPSGPQPPPSGPSVPNVQRVPAATPRPRRPAATPWPQEHSIDTLPTRVRGAYESIPDDVQGFSAWILTPQSSNVHAVAYDYDTGILYVQFRAEGKPVGYKEGISICSGKAYKIAIRPDTPGPIYSYGSAGRPVPVEIFNTLASSRSPGKVVWDKLRVCGSQWQHQYQYTLTDVPAGQNVPRKATRRGLQVRTVPTVGLGRRGGRRSTLPQRVR